VRVILDNIIERIHAHLPPGESEPAARFAEQYIHHCQAEDLRDCSVENLYGAVMSLWRALAERPVDTPLIHIYNPDFDEYGWQSSHTVIEIVTRDMPFLVDSISMAITKAGIAIHLLNHPVITVDRGDRGYLRNILPVGEKNEHSITEAVMHIEIDRHNDAEQQQALCDKISHVLSDVAAVVNDWKAMRGQLKDVIETLTAQSLPIPADEKAESLAFLHWLDSNHFTFIGYRSYDLIRKQGELHLKHVTDSGLGILHEHHLTRVSRSFAQVPPEIRAAARQPSLLILTKSTAVSTVHRPVHLDYIGIKRYDDTGTVVGEWRFLGLYSSLAYSERVVNIPILRRKVEYVSNGLGFRPGGHNHKTLTHILDTFPRDEMFQFTEQELLDTVSGILRVMERHRLGLFLRKDIYERFITALVYVPREHYSTELRQRLQALLQHELGGDSSEFNVMLGDAPLARVHFIIRTRPGAIPDYDLDELHNSMLEAMLSWQDKLLQALHEHYGEDVGSRHFQRFGHAFSTAYEADFNPYTAVADIERLLRISHTQPLAVHLYRPLEEGLSLLHFKVYGQGRTLALSDILPMLENLGLHVIEARPYEITAGDDAHYWIIDFDMQAVGGSTIDVLAIKDKFQTAFLRVCSGDMGNDGFNRLVLTAGLDWRQVVLLRALAKYLLQTKLPFSQAYMENTLAQYPELARQLVELFERRMDPTPNDEDVQASIDKILAGIDQVTSLDSDRILRQYLHLIQAILRTNYFQHDGDGQQKGFLSFKLDPHQVPSLPLPLPAYEIFVYSPRVEGVHLRGGAVARGGIRWSDRREDYRTEILGLMKAQMVKNTVIVPVGAKGGFIVKRLPEEREAQAAEVRACYQIFIRGLLELTDNLVSGVIVPPPDTRRYDGDDPYLVVAADKGTATFSDTANDIALEMGFWLGDAFASGGSSGYDHKKMGITARGAWEAVKRHFHERGIDTQAHPFTVVGIGSMTGDVFGNGMLLSPFIKLVAAFNHSRIFIDPDPDPAASFAERKRLFELPRSNWDDYNPELISAGGGVYKRSAKHIALSEQARHVLGIEAEQLTPNELIQALLKAPVDLLWNGGIGTYVKASSETNADAGDRANDAVRVNGNELRCHVVGEGGNLGFTQLGRVEYAQKGGALNTDFIDNSGGVDCSDHEVNIKVLLGQIIADGDMTLKQRDALLVDMTDTVAELVLKHCYQQTQALSITSKQSPLMLADHARFIRKLEKSGRLKRRLEFLPDDDELVERQKHNVGLSRPEIAIFFSYSKIWLYETLHATDICEDPYLSEELVTYFPHQIQERFVDRMQSHPLRREIITTQITNSLVNRMGGTFVMRLQDLTGATVGDIARCYTAAREIFNARELWAQVEALDKQANAAVQIDMLIEIRRLLDRVTVWLLRHRTQPIDIAVTIGTYQHALKDLGPRLPNLLRNEGRASARQQTRQLFKAGVPKALAQEIALMQPLYSGLDIVDLAAYTYTDLNKTAEVFYGLEARLDLFWLRQQIHDLPRQDLWQRKARLGLLDELQTITTEIARLVITTTEAKRSGNKKLDDWLTRQQARVSHVHELLQDIRNNPDIDLAMLTVAVREIKNLTHEAG